ncbi:SERINE-THREONINE PROTEIN KINASE [Salix purpurea]|uniref:SERINE-THREONINE PROTEIN KINASE n=1 Tax=Salix purpurea TaxID=77065 RepID=A0A9Q0UKG7_SALPP|nr:SERINE-THREONINE PROTEIN KINASE [Salix purpurea]
MIQCRVKKVKFLCSFGGKILPRPSDGMLRYAGGQTRIISVRRDVSINELQRKMMDTYQQPAVIKYQLPNEDLDALVSVSCADDLDNMMEEYEKLLERSSDGSAKLRLNGVVDGGGGRITRKESMTSVSSTQNSDFSGTEAVESSGPGQGDVTWPPSTSLLSPGDNLATSHDSTPKLIFADTNTLAYAGVSAVPLGIPMAKSGPPQTSCSQSEVEFERSVPTTAQPQHRVLDFQQVGPGILPHAPQLRAYGPVFTQQHYNKSNADTSSLQYVPAMHMSTTPSGSQMAISPTAVQPQQTRLEQYPEENAFGKRIVQVPVDSSYNAYRAQLPPVVVGGYGWTQVPQPEPVIYSDGPVSHQQVLFPEKTPRMEDCFMCQKTLPHAHSDPLVPGPKESGMNYSNSLHHSLRLENTMKAPPMNRTMITGTLGECIMEQGAGAQPAVHSHIRTPQSEAIVSSQNLEAPHENERTFLKNDNSGQPKISAPYGMIGLPGDVQSPYGMLHHSVSMQPQVLLSKPANSDVSHAVAVPIQASEHLVQESPKEYSGKLPGVVSQEDAVAVDSYISCDQLRPVDGMMEALYIHPPEINVNNDQKKSPVDKFKKEEILDHKTQQTTGREVLLDNILNKPQVVLESNHIKQFEMLPASTEISYLHMSRPMELHEVAQPPILGNKASHLQPKIGVPAFDSAEVIYGIPAFSGVEPAYVNDRIPPLVEHKNDSQLQSKVVPSDVEALSLTGNMPSSLSPSSLSPSSGVGNAQDSSNSLFSIQDPWKSRHDNHFRPPRPNKFATKKEVFTTRDPFIENYSGEVDLITGVLLEDGVSKPLSNSNKDSERAQSSQGSTEELIRQELKAVAECVAASVFQPATSNPEQKVSERNEYAYEQNQEKEDSNESVEIQHKAKLEDMKNKLPEKVNSGFPVSEGRGHLQIIKNSDLEELQELGSGTFGTVYHGKWRGTDVAIKRISDRCFAGKPSEQERMKDDFWNEAINLADLHHPNVVAFYGVVLDGLGGSVATVTEFMVNGSLRNALLKSARNLDKRKRLLIAMDVAFGMGYLHGKNVVHFDLKSDNLLVNLRDPHRPICKYLMLIYVFKRMLISCQQNLMLISP